MKRLVIPGLLVVLTISSARAQENLIPEDIPQHMEIAPDDSLVQYPRYSHSTDRGRVFILPYDNMPCLVPYSDRLAPMPGADRRQAPGYRMPNATPRYRIPKNKD